MKTPNKLIAIIITSVSILFFGQSCVFDLEEDTSSVLSLENLKSENDIEASLAPIYRIFQKSFAPHTFQITGYGSDDITTWSGGNKAPLRVFDRFDYGAGENSAINFLDATWDSSWKMIYYSNTLINGLKTSTAPEDVIKIADGEARFLRAFAYLILVKRWGNLPIILENTNPTGNETRATVLENYQHIEADLKIAESSLPEPGAVGAVGRASNSAAKTLLADLYLTWSGWPVKDESKYQLAANKAKEVIDLGYFQLLPIDKLWLLENQNSRESVFSIQFSKSEDIQSPWPANTSFHESRGWSDLFPERQFFNDFPESPRKEATFYKDIPQRGVANGTIVDLTPPTKPWKNSQRKHPMYKKFAISGDLTVSDRIVGYRAIEFFRYAEVLLIYAEASAHINGGSISGDAIEALNQVRRRAAGLPYDQQNSIVDVISATADQIVDEKGWELAGEAKRWNDLVRLERVAEVAAKRDVSEEVPLAKPASEITWKQYIAPIPFQAISTSKLVQNPEGFKIAP